MSDPHLDGMTIVVPMNAFAFVERKTGLLRFYAGWAPSFAIIVAPDKAGMKLPIQIPIVSVVDTLSAYENSEHNRRKLWDKLFWDELSNEAFRAKTRFERDRDEQLNVSIDIELEFANTTWVHAAALNDRTGKPPELKASLDLTEQCISAMAMLALERMR